MAQIEPMNIDVVDDNFDNKENNLCHSNVLHWTPCAEKTYEELDASEMNMKLRYSMTPTSSPMSKSLTSNCFENRTFDNEDYINNMMIHDNNNLTRSLNSTITKSEPIRSLKSLPLQTISTGQVGENRSPSALCLLLSKPKENNVTVTGSDVVDYVENNSLSSASSLTHTPEAITPTKEISKHDGGSPIIRGLKSVLNMFRSSQSPIPPPENKQISQTDMSLDEQCSKDSADCKTGPIVASTPVTTRHRQCSSSRRSSPLKGSIVFSEDLERELQWKDETTILFKDEKIPIHKLFPPHSIPSTSKTAESLLTSKEERIDHLNSSENFMDISNNVSMVQNNVIIQNEPFSYSLESVNMESDGEFVDCENTVNEDLCYNKSTKGENEDLIAISLQQQNLLLAKAPNDSLQPVNANDMTKDVPPSSPDLIQTLNISQARQEVTDAFNEINTDQKLEDCQLFNMDKNCRKVDAILCKESEKDYNGEIQITKDLPMLQNDNMANTNNEIQDDQNSENNLNMTVKKCSECSTNITSKDICGVCKNSSKENVDIINPSEGALTDEGQVKYLNNSEETSMDMDCTMPEMEKKTLLGDIDISGKCKDIIIKEEGGSKECDTMYLNQTTKKTSLDFIYNYESKIADHEDKLFENETAKCFRNQIIENSECFTDNNSNEELNSRLLEICCINPIDLNENKACKILCEHVENEPEQCAKCTSHEKIFDNMLDNQCKVVNKGDNIMSSSNKSDFELANTPKIINLKDYNAISLQAHVAFGTLNNSTEQKKDCENVEIMDKQKEMDLTVPAYDLSLNGTHVHMWQSDNMQQTEFRDHIEDLPKINKRSDECPDVSLRAQTDYVSPFKSSIHEEIVSNVKINVRIKMPVDDVTNQPEYQLDMDIHQKEHCRDDNERFSADNLHPVFLSTMHTTDMDMVQLQPCNENVKEKLGVETQISTLLNSSLNQNNLHIMKGNIVHNNKMLHNSVTGDTGEVYSEHSLIDKYIIENEKEQKQKQKLDNNIEPVGKLSATVAKLSLPPSLETSPQRCDFNFDEIDDPFATKSKIRMSPSLLNSPTTTNVNIHTIYPIKEEKKIVYNECGSELDTPIIVDNSEPKNVFNLPEMSGMFTPKSKISASHALEEKSYCECELPANSHPLDDLQEEKARREQSIAKIEDTLFLTTRFSSQSSKDDIAVGEGNTEDEDTAEGPFFESEQSSSNEKICDQDNKIQFSDISAQGLRDKADNEEMFIDAEAYEFLLNQNRYNVVADSGKESLFLKFDPLFAKRLPSDGVSAIFSKIRTRQSTPKKISEIHSTEDSYYERVVTTSTNTNINVDIPNPIETNFEDPNVTVSKPMMVVNPAINSIVSPRNRSYTPPRTNRRSLTFASPAIAVIDRLLSLSANNSPSNHETSFARECRENNDTDQALTQLRELLAEKEIQAHNLRLESKELKDRLCTLESQIKSLESQGEQKLRRINELNDTLSEKNKINKSMAVVLEEYERTMASLIAEIEQDKKSHAQERSQLKNERNEQAEHLASMELAFNDLHSKYNKSKQIIESCKVKEDAYLASLKQTEENFLKMHNNYELLKQHATSKLNRANHELELMNTAHDAEMLKLNAMVKRKDVDISSLKETLAQKSKTNEELTALCDELIRKVS